MIKVRIGKTIAIYENGAWSCLVNAFRETLEAFTELERLHPSNEYAPDRNHPPALRAARVIGEVVEQTEVCLDFEDDPNVRF